jgi:hypothetical protein
MTFPLILGVPRTDEEIVEQTNVLARLALRFLGTGYEVADDHRFYDEPDPRSQKAWAFACEIQELMTATDPNDALSAAEEPKPEPRYVVQPYQADHGETYVLYDTLREIIMSRSLSNSIESIDELNSLADTMNAAEEEGE